MKIKVGDLVMVVRNNGHVCFDNEIGTSFVVAEMVEDVFHCIDCLQIFPFNPLAISRGSYATPVSWLMKIDPPANMETIEHESAITA
jgi:hypothetical protein